MTNGPCDFVSTLNLLGSNLQLSYTNLFLQV